MITHTFAICAYGDSPYLEACIRSLKRQTVKAEIILCTSTPSTFIENLSEKYEIPVFVREGSSDIQDDWNFAYQSADSELITIAHQDDMYHRDYKRVLLDNYRKYPDMIMFTTDYATVKGRVLHNKKTVEWIKLILRLPLRYPRFNHMAAVKKSVLVFGNPICCPSCTYQKKALGPKLFTSEFRYALDWDTLYQLACGGGRFICVERPLMYYRVHDGATTKKWIADNRRSQEELAMFRKFWPEAAVKILSYFYKKAYSAYD